MSTTPPSRLLNPHPDFKSAEPALFFAQLEDLSKRLWDAVRDATPAELAWQPYPGMNTIAMLLAHIAITEVFWVSVLTERAFVCEKVIGIGPDDDGMPMPEDGAPPPTLAGKALPFYQDLLMRARENTREALVGMADGELAREIEHRRRDGVQTLTGRWILYHMVEHLAGHYGQIGVLRHLHRAAAGRGAPAV